MKANEAPERIWINSPQDLPCGHIDNNSVEYTRTDAFIEKACKWLKSKGGFTIGFDGATVKDFLDYINK